MSTEDTTSTAGQIRDILVRELQWSSSPEELTDDLPLIENHIVDSLSLLRRSGVACLLGIDGRPQAVTIDGPVLGLDAILENRVLFGSVNAHRQDWLAAVESLDRARERWPEALEAFVGRRVPLDRFAEAFAYRGVKATLVLG